MNSSNATHYHLEIKMLKHEKNSCSIDVFRRKLILGKLMNQIEGFKYILEKESIKVVAIIRCMMVRVDFNASIYNDVVQQRKQDITETSLMKRELF